MARRRHIRFRGAARPAARDIGSVHAADWQFPNAVSRVFDQNQRTGLQLSRSLGEDGAHRLRAKRVELVQGESRRIGQGLANVRFLEVRQIGHDLSRRTHTDCSYAEILV